MFDGVIRTLRNVRYILTMRKNLIALRVLDTNGYQWAVTDGILQVKADDKIILKGKKHRTLYVLEGDTLCGEANVAQSSAKIDYMWHSRLGHMGEKNMAILFKNGLLPKMQSTSMDFCEHCSMESKQGKLLGLERIVPRKFLCIYIVTCGVLPLFPHILESYTMYQL